MRRDSKLEYSGLGSRLAESCDFFLSYSVFNSSTNHITLSFFYSASIARHLNGFEPVLRNTMSCMALSGDTCYRILMRDSSMHVLIFEIQVLIQPMNQCSALLHTQLSQIPSKHRKFRRPIPSLTADEISVVGR